MNPFVLTGQTAAATMLSAPLLLAGLVLATGTTQLPAVLRHYWPRIHRWSGSLFVIGSMIAAASALQKVWSTGAAGDLMRHLAVSLNALVVFSFASLAWGHALAHRIDAQRGWTLRLFLAVASLMLLL